MGMQLLTLLLLVFLTQLTVAEDSLVSKRLSRPTRVGRRGVTPREIYNITFLSVYHNIV